MVLDMIADLLAPDSPQVRPDSPAVRPAESRAVAGDSLNSPNSPHPRARTRGDLAELQAAAGPDWPAIRDNPEALAALANLLSIRAMRERGQVPAHYTQASECVSCGPVWLWEGAPKRVLGCPWCFNRAAGRPIPRPGGAT